MSPSQIKFIRLAILRWFADHERALPWRSTKNPWYILVSEIMLQQTQVSRVLPKYQEFIGRWSTPKGFASLSLAEVLRFWSGLGYNRRAKLLHLAAQQIMVRHRGRVPLDVSLLRKLSGVGEYTARAVVSFADNQDVACVDTNIRRIFLRVLWGGEFAESHPSAEELQLALDQIVPKGKSRIWHNALMDFGSLVCRSRDPQCIDCPLLRQCKSGKNFLHGSAPVQSILRPQKKFLGSRRQVRGAILRKLSQSSDIVLLKIFSQQFPTHDVNVIIQELVREGLVRVKDNHVALPD